ncbi:MAG: ABC transporter ATP-binding protein [Bacteroidetes bacterium]|nr:ABC transporter ATP-binding protein [Bacteroidota bacterium]
MISITLQVKNIAKEFNRKKLFENISFDADAGSAIAVTGKNGSGKSTLVKILCGLLEPTRGTWVLTVEDKKIPHEEYYKNIGLVSPYLNLYDEFSGIENLDFIAKIRRLQNPSTIIESVLEDFGLFKHRKKEVKYYSSGMKQRLKYCAALLHKPEILFLDEPQSNLDSEGISVVRTYMKQQRERGILIFATNDEDDLSYADAVIKLNSLNIEK